MARSDKRSCAPTIFWNACDISQTCNLTYIDNFSILGNKIHSTIN